MMDEHPSEAQLLLALDRELEAPDAARVADHVRACPACRAAWDHLATLSDDLEQYCRTWEPVRAIVANPIATREIVAQEGTQWQRSWRDWATSGSTAFAAAAVALLLIGVSLLLARSGAFSRTPDRHEAAASAKPTAAHARDVALAPASAAPSVDVPKRGTVPTLVAQAPATAATPRKPHPRVAQTSTTVQRAPTYYWPLPYSNGALPLSEGSVVMNVRLSRDQLRLAGIPDMPLGESQDRPNRSFVRAKVLVGADGLPRAIAFDQD